MTPPGPLDRARAAACAALSRLVPEVALDGRRSSLALALAPPAAGRVARVRCGPVTVLVGDGTEEERVLHHWSRPLLRHYQRSLLGRALVLGAGGGTFVDVGANLGVYSAIAAGAGWEVVRYEPDARLRPHHERNPSLGAFHPVALAAAPGRRPFFAEGAARGAASLVATPSGGGPAAGPGDEDVVVTETADAAVLPEVRGSSAPTLVKVDVEGAEGEVVGGAGALLAEVRPVLWCEVRGRASTRAPATDALVTGALPAGYRVLACADDHLRPWTGPGAGGVYDIVAVPDTGPSAGFGTALVVGLGADADADTDAAGQ